MTLGYVWKDWLVLRPAVVVPSPGVDTAGRETGGVAQGRGGKRAQGDVRAGLLVSEGLELDGLDAHDGGSRGIWMEKNTTGGKEVTGEQL